MATDPDLPDLPIDGSRVLVSAGSGPAGERVTVTLDAGCRLLMVWADRDEPSDVTAWSADLVLLGWVEASLDSEAAAPPTETVEIGHLTATGPVAVHLLTGDGQEYLLDPATGLAWLARGVTAQVTAGVAHEAATIPDQLEEQDG